MPKAQSSMLNEVDKHAKDKGSMVLVSPISAKIISQEIDTEVKKLDSAKDDQARYDILKNFLMDFADDINDEALKQNLQKIDKETGDINSKIDKMAEYLTKYIDLIEGFAVSVSDKIKKIFESLKTNLDKIINRNVVSTKVQEKSNMNTILILAAVGVGAYFNEKKEQM